MRLLVLAGLATLALSCGGASTPPVSAPSPILDKPLPEIAGPTTNGRELTKDTLANKVVVVKFFAKYCEPCKKTLPKAEALHRSNSDVVFIGVAEDEAKADVDEMIQTYDLTFPVIHDPENAVASRFNVSQLPATFVTDASGHVKWVGAPGQPEGDLGAAIAWAKKAATTSR